MSATIKEPPTYTFGRRDRGGLLLGFKATQLATLAVGFGAVLIGVLTAGSTGGLVGFTTLMAAGFLALYPVQGRALVDWARPVANHLYARALGGSRSRYLGGVNALHRCKDLRLDLPGLGQNLRVYQARPFEGPVAAIRVGDRWTIILKVRGRNYVLADSATQERRIADWGALLSQCGQEGSRIAAIQWLERTVPDSGHDLTTWWAEHGDPTAPYAAAYAQLLEKAGPAATRHESFFAVSIDAHKLRRPIRQTGGGPEGTTKVLLAEVTWIRQALTRADIDVIGTVDAADLARLVRSQYDPVTATLHEEHDRTPLLGTAGPMAAHAHWDHYQTDSGLHAVYWIAEWPSVPVEAAWIYPLISLGGIRRTVSVTAEPIPPSRSMRELRSHASPNGPMRPNAVGSGRSRPPRTTRNTPRWSAGSANWSAGTPNTATPAGSPSPPPPATSSTTPAPWSNKQPSAVRWKSAGSTAKSTRPSCAPGFP